MKNLKLPFSEKLFYFILAGAVWLYVVLRGIFVPLTIDELSTFYHFVQPGKILPGSETLWDANNHLLNTLLTRLSYLAFGNDGWALRLPSMLISLFYFIYTYKIASLLKDFKLRWGFILAFLFGHFLIEFFSFTRGYGISIALLTASIYYSLRWIETRQWKNLAALMFFMSVAVFSNLTLLITSLILQFIMWCMVIAKAKAFKAFLQHAGTLIFLGLLPTIFFVWYGFQLKQQGLLYYGEKDGFWQVTVKSLVKYFTWEGNFIGEVVVGLLFAALLMMQVARLKSLNWRNLLSLDRFLFTLFIGNIIASISMNWILDTNFAEDRVGLFYYPFFVLSLAFTINHLKWKFKPQISWGLLALFSLIPFHFAFKANLTYSTLWDFDAPMKGFVQTILEEEKNKSEEEKRDLLISAYQLRGFPYYYYNMKLGSKLNMILNKGFVNGVEDYQICERENCNKWDSYEPIDFDKRNGFYLLKRKTPLETKTVFTSQSMSTLGRNTNEFENLLIHEVPESMWNKHYRVNFDLTIDAKEEPLRNWMVFELKNEQETLIYSFIALNWLQKRWNGEKNNFSYSTAYEVPKGTKEFLIYFWNVYDQDYDIIEGKVELQEYEEE